MSAQGLPCTCGAGTDINADHAVNCPCNLNYLDKRLVNWKSSFCGCTARMTVDGIDFSFTSCDKDHEKWSMLIGREQCDRRRSELRPYQRNKYPQKLQIYLNHVKDRSAKLFRPPLLPKAGKLSAEQAMWDLESVGVEPVECADPDRLADYIQGKSLLGLMLEDLQEQYSKFLFSAPKDTFDKFIFWGEEFVVEELITESMFESIYLRKPDKDLLAYFQTKQEGEKT